MLHVPSLLLISGNGRDSGKTTFACKLIRHFSKELDVTGIKISPHFHEMKDYEEVIFADDFVIITRERNTSSGKDSSRMLRSGARKVFYIQAGDKLLPTALMKLAPLWESRKPVICESGGLINYLTPGLFFMLSRSDISGQKSAENHYDLVNRWIYPDEQNIDLNIDAIAFSNSRWHLNNSK